MKYLVKKKKAKVAHLWTGADTICRMASTGGLNKGHSTVVERTNLPICSMCDERAKQNGLYKATDESRKGETMKQTATMNYLLSIIGEACIEAKGLLTWEEGLRAIIKKCDITIIEESMYKTFGELVARGEA